MFNPSFLIWQAVCVMIFPCWLCKCSVNTVDLKCKVSKNGLAFPRHKHHQAKHSEMTFQGLEVQAVAWSLLGTARACLYRLILEEDGASRTAGMRQGPPPLPYWPVHQRRLCQALCSTPRPGRSKSPDKLGFWAAPVLIINCHFGDSRGSNMTGLPQPRILGRTSESQL